MHVSVPAARFQPQVNRPDSNTVRVRHPHSTLQPAAAKSRGWRGADPHLFLPRSPSPSTLQPPSVKTHSHRTRLSQMPLPVPNTLLFVTLPFPASPVNESINQVAIRRSRVCVFPPRTTSVTRLLRGLLQRLPHTDANHFSSQIALSASFYRVTFIPHQLDQPPVPANFNKFASLSYTNTGGLSCYNGPLSNLTRHATYQMN